MKENKGRKEKKKERKEFKHKRRQEMGRTFNKSRNIASFVYYMLGIAFFTITLLLLFGILRADVITSWFGG